MACQAGYRRIDTAYMYGKSLPDNICHTLERVNLSYWYGTGTERSVGRAIKESGIPREEIFVTTKLP